ncbi:MAG TPA: hypothetical protein VK564_13585, partial [Thermodesulfobacteriota bacterium]|nr:hypothetical protein [Thermodesulfobacteriota bacterium]
MKEKRKETAPGMIPGLVLGLIFMMALAGPALAQGPVLRTSPAQDCAVVTSMPGFPKFKTSSLVEKEIFIEGEGVVIRQSQVKNGKIYIPPGGLYYTVRTHWFQGELRWPLANYPMLLLGKTYYLADAGHNYGVKRDFVVKKGEAVPFGEGGNALELSSVENSWGDESPNHPAVFRVLKPSGNYYGNQWGTSTGGRYARSVEDALKGKPAKAPMVYQLSPLATVGTAYLLAEEVTLKQAKISQWGFSEVMTVDLAEKAVTATAGVGGTM